LLNIYKNLQFLKIDGLLKDDKLPIIVGGTNYYIESVLWDITIEDPEVCFEP
jgi:tRNA dimethylallyltransferase